MTADWTLDSELIKLTDAASPAEALRRLGLLDRGDDRYTISASPTGWFRAGSETYIYRFSIATPTREIPLILKACVAFSPGSSVDAILRSWIERRHLLANRGVVTPTAYAWGYGVILEEYVEFEITHVIKQQVPHVEHTILFSLAELAGVVSSCGFLPIGLFQDLRSHGADVVIVDFGQDLGSPAASEGNNVDLFAELLKFLEFSGVTVDDSERRQMLAVFESQFHIKAH